MKWFTTTHPALPAALLRAALARCCSGSAGRERDVLAIVLSGLCMELTMLRLGATPDYRYSHWLVVTTCLAIVMLIAAPLPRCVI